LSLDCLTGRFECDRGIPAIVLAGSEWFIPQNTKRNDSMILGKERME
jgi:hypothetical protein